MRGVSLAEVSAATRISTRFWKRLRVTVGSRCRDGVFTRGFIRSVARYLGLDEDSMVAEYALETRGRVEAGVVPDPPMEMPRNWKPAMVAAIVLVVILAGVGFAYARYGGKIAERLHGKPTAATAPVASATSGEAARGANDAATGAAGAGSAAAGNGAAQNSKPSEGAAGTTGAAAADPLETHAANKQAR